MKKLNLCSQYKGFANSKSIYAHWNILLPIFIGIIYLYINRNYDGPAFQQDEIGYLINAAFLAGFVVDGYSSYHAGYSIFLAPLFYFFNNPDEIWKGVKIVNAVFWSGSFYLLDLLVKRILPSLGLLRRMFVVVACAVYPTWMVIAGYGFSQSAFVFFYTASILALFKWQPEKPNSILLHTALVGFLFWIHPTAAGVIVASMIVIGLGCWKCDLYKSLIIHLFVLLALVVAYRAGIQPWMMKEMTPDGYVARSHYPSMALLLSSATKLKFWVDLIIVIFGQFAYLSIATFGVVIIGVYQLINSLTTNIFEAFKASSSRESTISLTGAFLLLSVLALMTITGISFASQSHGPGSLDEWFYGRYVEGVVLPLMAVGIASWQRQGVKKGLMIAAAIICIGVLINSLSAKGAYLNLVNIQGFWPQALAPESSVVMWFVIGAAGVAICVVFFRPMMFLLLIPVVFFTSKTHLDWHGNILVDYSRPSEMIEFVRQNFARGDCVGFDPYLSPKASLQMIERIRLYSFYLFDFDYRRMDRSDWENHCDGPFFTFNPNHSFSSASIKLVAFEPKTGLRLFVKNKDVQFVPTTADARFSQIIWGGSHAECIMDGKCIFLSGMNLAKKSQVGKFDNNVLTTDGRTGLLFYGPYLQLKKGRYVIEMHGTFDNLDGVIIDVVSNGSKATHFQARLTGNIQYDKQTIKLQFTLEKNVNDIEVRLFVDGSSSLSISALDIQPVKMD